MTAFIISIVLTTYLIGRYAPFMASLKQREAYSALNKILYSGADRNRKTKGECYYA